MRAVAFIGYSLLCSALLAVFVQLHDVSRYLFSLIALLLGVRFFRNYDSMGTRIGFVATVFVLAMLFSLIYSMAAEMNGWYYKKLE
ncbi:hypothetical protein [Paenibacillus sp. y28]|uniref:hypothetical protein n=1 Tax=Paenibacillus sp. y28 TaxID=3129110 RepID=UPI00301770E5